MSVRATIARAGVASVAIAASVLPAHAARAQTDAAATKPPTLVVHAAPIFGTETSVGDGWTEVAVNVDNVGPVAQKGTLELVAGLPWSRADLQGATTRAAFNIAAGRSVVVQLPTHGMPYQSTSWTLTAKDDAGATLASTTLPTSGNPAPLLVDVDQPSPLSIVMRTWPVATTWSPFGYTYGYMAPGSKPPLAVGSPTFDRTTGDPILPEHPAGYGPVTVVLVHSDTLAKLEGPKLDALVSWVIGGGTLAVVPTRPEDLRTGVVARLVGGPVTAAPPPGVLLTLPSTEKPSGTGLYPGDPLDDAPPAPSFAPTPPPTPIPPAAPVPPPTTTPAPPTTPTATPMLWDATPAAGAGGAFVPIRTVTPFRPRVGPPPEVRAKLQGFTGGNLEPSVFGASAAYGTGEVHLLAFDPTTTPLVDDAWVQTRVVELVAHAWDRRAVNVVSSGAPDRNGARMDDVRRALDPNENFRPALGIAAILLVLYSILVGPVTFMRAAKRGRPLDPLKWAPACSAATFGVIVLIGLAGKGWRGRARHLALVEVGAGVTRGPVQRFRGFFTSQSRTLSVGSTDAQSVLRVATSDSSSGDASALRLDRNGASLENITSLPWQTIVVREDGMLDLKGGVAVAMAPDGSVDVANHTGSVLSHVLVSVPGDGVHYFPKLVDGQRVHGADGALAFSYAARRLSSAGGVSVHELGATLMASGISGKDGEALSRTWQPMETAFGESVDWWPDTVPIVLGELEGGEGAKRDGTLSVESDRLLVRVVGKGGVL